MHVTFAKCGNAARCEVALSVVGTTYSKHGRFRDSSIEIEAKYGGRFFFLVGQNVSLWRTHEPDSLS